MIKRLLLSLCVIIFFASAAFSQGATIKGQVKDPNGAGVQFANVTLKQEGKVVNAATATINGDYVFNNVAPGKYDLAAQSAVGMGIVQGVDIYGSMVKLLDIPLSSNLLDPVVVVYEKPPFEADNNKQGASLDRETVTKTPGRNVDRALSSTAGVSTDANGDMQAVRGNRSDGQSTYVDGIRVSGTGSVPMDAIGETELITGGIPAEFGDATSVTNITTRSIPQKIGGSIELRGSVEGYNNFLAAAAVYGPLMKGKNKDDMPIIGFLLTAEGSYNKDSGPARGGTWRATQDAIDYLVKNPYRYEAESDGTIIFRPNASFLTFDSEINGKKVFVKKRVRDDAQNYGGSVSAKLDFMPPTRSGGQIKSRVQLSIGGSFNYFQGKSWGLASSLFNSSNNIDQTQYSGRVNARLNHVLYTDTTGQGLIKNISYNIILGYTNTYTHVEGVHKLNYFDYGYIGKFTTTRKPSFSFGDIDIDGISYKDMWIYLGDYNSQIDFTASDKNPQLVPYTQNFIDQFPPSVIREIYGENVPIDLNMYDNFGALYNGQLPDGTYSLYSSPNSGAGASPYKVSSQSIQAKASFSMNVQNHDFKLGFQFEKETHRAYQVIGPYSLWTLMRTSANSHTTQLDLHNPIIMGDTVFYNQLVALDAQKTFDRNLRIKLGLDPNGSDWIDINNLDPSTFDLSMFEAEELLVGNGSPMVSYYGYDYTGNKTNKKTSITDFFNAKNSDGKRTYNIGAYEPVYMSIYLQDKFSIKSLIFNVGVRVDRFDANQEVLKDPFLFRDAYTVGDLKGIGVDNSALISNAGNDWVVYVNQKDNTFDASSFDNSSIVAYRNGRTWYDKNGKEVSDPELALTATGGPILKNAIDKSLVTKVEAAAFKDYKPQWTWMPRLSFSFPVNIDNSLFFANYSIVTTRPTNLQINPIEYLFIETYGPQKASINNPDLKPQRSIDYEIGFKQKIGQRSALNISAYYSEKKDMIQVYRFSGAYPTTYYSYDNLDFGTVQGVTLGYIMQQTKGVRMNVSYSLQFAQGTGSNAESQKSLIASGQPNLRTLTNLEYDQRHSISAILSYEFASGKDYPDALTTKKVKLDKEGNQVSKEIRWLENVGIYLNLGARSGMPYSRSSRAYSNWGFGTTNQLVGSINGSYKPWQFQVDLRVEKGFSFKNKNKEGVKAKNRTVIVYLDVTNLLNLKNIISVYGYTGSPEDDGFLSSEQYQNYINGQLWTPSFIDYYTMMVKNPYNYSRPAQVNLGIQFAF